MRWLISVKNNTDERKENDEIFSHMNYGGIFSPAWVAWRLKRINTQTENVYKLQMKDFHTFFAATERHTTSVVTRREKSENDVDNKITNIVSSQKVCFKIASATTTSNILITLNSSCMQSSDPLECEHKCCTMLTCMSDAAVCGECRHKESVKIWKMEMSGGKKLEKSH